jgi:hypothetical protein
MNPFVRVSVTFVSPDVVGSICVVGIWVFIGSGRFEVAVLVTVLRRFSIDWLPETSLVASCICCMRYVAVTSFSFAVAAVLTVEFTVEVTPEAVVGESALFTVPVSVPVIAAEAPRAVKRPIEMRMHVEMMRSFFTGVFIISRGKKR